MAGDITTTTTSTTSNIIPTRSCDACYNGCVETVSDQCVRYTGPDSLALEIQTGDSLAIVEERLIDYLTSCLDGTGINVAINPGIICPVVETFLPVTPDCIYTVPEYLTALTRSICYVQDEISVLQFELGKLQGIYNVNCLVGVLPDSGTVAILQATINRLCVVDFNLTALTLNVNNNYVKLSDLNSLIQAYLDEQSGNNSQQYKKMIPYVALEYYGPLTNFDGAGAGLQSLGWDKVYLCNGANGTPDKRGRVGVGAIQDVPGGPLNPAVDPAYTGNPNYNLGDTGGVNSVVLGVNNLPTHTHTPAVVVTEAPHDHSLASVGTNGEGGPTLGPGGTLQVEMAESGNGSYRLSNSTTALATLGKTSSTLTNITVGVTNANTGSNVPHTNIQPVVAAYYIMYIP